ncbi:AraC family transcriptional regulator [Nocardia arthritidis]|uniref:Helix-turn-helix domain-containing protein n=1 Tax=Nocardia arthritidis TaxID=228602 RepID=A0A6G9YLS7_9NOCA|nr:AraC family transcriptional regulator [Nocardia arthritidis]QIS14090.1 helix-turn-helix domain-containing protein [Nocardia arthritidis]
MFDWDLVRNTSSVHVMAQLAAERGMSATELFAGTSLTPELVRDGDAVVTARQEVAVIRNLLRRFGDEPGLGAEAGRRYHIALYGPWGLALLSSGTVRQVIEVALGYLDLAFVFGHLRFEEGPQQSKLVFDGAEVPLDVRPFLAERITSGIQTIGRELFAAGVPAERVTYRHSAPAEVVRYREIFGVEPDFDADEDAIAFASAYLDFPLPQADEWTRTTCEQLCHDMLERRRARQGTAGAVRDVLARNPAALPDQAAVAAELFISPRTLARRLSEEGTSFRALVDEVRQLLAEELLAHTDMTSEQVALRLGYADGASFIRAFRRWNGCPPQEFRQHRPSVPVAMARR